MLRNIFTALLLVCLTSPCLGFTTKAKQALLVDADTGAVLFEKNAYVRMVPSSMSKLMTLYIAFDRLKSGQLKLRDKFIVSNNAWRTQGSRMFLAPNTYVSVEDLIRGIIVQSGNDASVTLAEGIAGSEPDFVELMNAQATKLGLKQSHFANATGLPHKDHYMSAADILTVGSRLIKDFHDYYHYFSEKDFVYNKITQPNRNLLLNPVTGVDGLKTGHTDLGKYGICVSACREGRRLIAVINGVANERERVVEATQLLQYGFLNFTDITVASAGREVVEVPVLLGEVKQVKLGTNQSAAFTVPMKFKGQSEIKIKYPSALEAPVDSEKRVGEITVRLYDGSLHSFDLYPLQNVQRVGWMRRFFITAKAFLTTFKTSLGSIDERVKITNA